LVDQSRKRAKMKWIEIVELRTVEGNKQLLKLQLKELIREVDEELQGKRIKIYKRVTIETDFSIHLFHETKRIETCGSELGLRLVSALKDFGMVNHSTWVETHSK